MARHANGPSGDERKRQILAAAMRVFAAKGYAGATNKDIAAEAGVTHGLIYHYFRDKRALFGAILAEYSPLAGSIDLLDAARAGDEPPRRTLQRLALALLAPGPSAENLPALRLMIGEALRDPEAAAVFDAATGRFVAALAAYLRDQRARGRIDSPDPLLAAHVIYGSLVHLVGRRGFSIDPILHTYTPEQIATAFAEMALNMLSPPVIASLAH